MEEQVYQNEVCEKEGSYQFYDPETKRMRGFLSEKVNNNDDNNRIVGQIGSAFSVSANYQCVNSINNNSSNSNILGTVNYANTYKHSSQNPYETSDNLQNQLNPYNSIPLSGKTKEDSAGKKLTIVFEPQIVGQNYQGVINQSAPKKMESEMSIDNCNYFKENFEEEVEPMSLQSATFLNLNFGVSSMHEEHTPTPTELYNQQSGQYFSQSVLLQNQVSNSSNSGYHQQGSSSSTSTINNENVCTLETKSSNASGSKQRSSGKKYNDRYIPNRVSSNLYNLMNPSSSSTSQSSLSQSASGNEETGGSAQQSDSSTARRYADNPRNEQNQKMYSNLLQSSILGESHELLQQSHNVCRSTNSAYILKDQTFVNYGQSYKFLAQKQKKLLTYSTKQQVQNYENELKIAAHNSVILSHEQNIRKIPKQPYKILESRNLQDDFYLNLLDWSPMNYLAVGLKNQVAIWSGCNSTITRLSGLGDVGVSSVSCSQRSNHIAVGDSIGNILIYDIQHKEQPLLKIEGHTDRIGSIAWNGSLIASGSKDKNILVRDLRAPQKCIQKYSGHKQEICGLKWSFDENILASGGNDNKLFLWTLKSRDELAKFSQHTAAVKALGFSPHQHNILASGGGTADRCIRFWNTQTLQQIDCLDTGSQVCNLMFSKNVNEIVSTHGYSLNQIIVWKYPSMKKIQTLTGHTQRVLYLAMSPCGQNVVTGAGDETLRFWNIFPSLKNKSNILGTSSLFPSCIDLR